ncbi:hypothetical protein ACFQZ4_50635 [Catellatospora coxensis]
MTDQPEITSFGRRHRRLRDLGDGWQLLETGSTDDPLDLAAATRSWAAVTATLSWRRTSVTATAGVYAITPDAASWAMHLPDPTRPCHVYRHLPEFADGRPQDDAVALLLEWAGSAGLQPDESHLRWLTGPEPRADRENNHVSADDLVFEMVLALGFTGIPESRPMAVDPGAAPST